MFLIVLISAMKISTANNLNYQVILSTVQPQYQIIKNPRTKREYFREIKGTEKFYPKEIK
jgi:hypothetical protein